MRTRTARLMAFTAAAALVVAACGDDGDDTDDTVVPIEEPAGDPGDEPVRPDEPEVPLDEPDDIDGASFSLFGAPTGVEGQAVTGFLGVYNDETGSEITYEGSDSFEEQLRIRVDGGNAPAAAFTPQPGSICEFADSGDLVSLETMGFDIDEMNENHGEFWMSLGRCDDGQHYGIPWFPNYKSIVWYRPDVFEAQGYQVPETYEGLIELTDQAVADGLTPWCFGFGSEAATGWPGTDWIEDIMLRLHGPEVYSAWYQNELPFDSPEVLEAFETFGEIFFADGAVLGGTANVAAIDFRDSPLPMFDEEPGCLMLKQGSFIANFFPEGDEDLVSFFPFPTIGGQGGAMGGGDTLIVFDDDPAVAAAVKDWITPEWQCVLASPGGGTASTLGGHGVPGVERLPGHKDVSLDCYETELSRIQAEAVRDAIASNTFVFDASDLMPPAVGQGTFWTAMIDWSRGTPAETVIEQVQGSWPAE